jgi:formamidopyrimidine-DNA glycosylase
MPELPEVQTVVDTLLTRVAGATFAQIRLLREDIITPLGFDFTANLTGRSVAQIARRGKRIVFTLDDQNRFYFHLGMTGRLTVELSTSPVEKHTHLICGLKGHGREIRFRDPRRFGGIWWIGSDDPDDDSIGPEPLTMRPAQLARRLARTKRAIKNVLLDQKIIAGLGNIYADEALFEARIHPLRPADGLRIVEIARLNRAIKLTLRRALRHRGSTLRDYVDANGETGNFQSLHRVYGREAEPCRVCRSKIRRIVLGGRSTHFCPNCQAHARLS